MCVAILIRMSISGLLLICGSLVSCRRTSTLAVLLAVLMCGSKFFLDPGADRIVLGFPMMPYYIFVSVYVVHSLLSAEHAISFGWGSELIQTSI